jgi:hypothetical protein
MTKSASRVYDFRNGAYQQYVLNAGNPAAQIVQNWAISNFENAQPTGVGNYAFRNTETMALNDYYASPGGYVGSPWSQHHMIEGMMGAYTRSISQALYINRTALHTGDSGDYVLAKCRGGVTANSDEGCVGLSSQVTQPLAPYGTIATGGASANTVKMTMTNNSGNQGDTGDAISLSEQMGDGLLTATTPGVQSTNTLGSVTTSDTHSVSTAMGILTAPCGANQIRNAPVSYTCTVTLTPSGSPLGSFATGTGPLGDVCVGDWRYPEQAQLVSVGTASTTQTLTLLLAYSHPANTPIYQGGMCGAKLALGNGWADPTNQESTRQFTHYFVAGSQTANTMDYVIVFKGGQNGLVNIVIPSAPNVSITSASSTSGVVTGTDNSNNAQYLGALAYNTLPTAATIQYLGGSNSSMNGVVTGVTIGGDAAPYQIAWNQSGGYTGTSTGGTLSVVGLNNYIAYCGAEIVALGNTSQSSPNGDGTLKLEPNHCNWPVALTAPIAGTAATSTSSGTLGAGSYSFKITYTNTYGETTPSPESTTYTLSASGNLSVNSPVAQGTASGWSVYITSTPGSGWQKQNSSPIAIGTPFVQSTALISGSAPPSTNTTGAIITPDFYSQTFAQAHNVISANTIRTDIANQVYENQISGLGMSDADTFYDSTSDLPSMYYGYGNPNPAAIGHTRFLDSDYITTWLNLKYGPINDGIVFSIGKPPTGGATQKYNLFYLYGVSGGGYQGAGWGFDPTTNLLTITNGGLAAGTGLYNNNSITVGDSSTQVPTTAFMNTAISNARSGVLNTATLTKATNVTSATCSGTCTSSRGYIAVVGGTQTTGTFLTLTWTTSTPTTFCSVTQEGGATWLALDRNSVSTTGVAFSSSNSISGQTFNLSYVCTP